MRLVLDTNVVASAMLWGGVPRLLLQAGRTGQIRLFTSAPMLAELTDILGRRKFGAKISASGLTLDELVDHYATLATLVRPTPTERIAPDPDDDVVIGTALAATADLIVTGDKPLLSVGEYRSIRIVGVAEAVKWADHRQRMS